MNFFLFLIILLLVLKYFFDINYINSIYKWFKFLAIIILLYLLYKYYDNKELKDSIIVSLNKIDKVPIDRTFKDIDILVNSRDLKNVSDDVPTSSKRFKRNVTNGQKKYVASIQKWKCGHCDNLLDASYEIDHVLALYKGGTNELDNLIALCRNCHGIKTMKERLNTK